MQKEMKKYGETLVISFTKEECRIYDLKPGKIIEVEISPAI